MRKREIEGFKHSQKQVKEINAKKFHLQIFFLAVTLP